MNGNSRSLAERVEQVLPPLNLAVLLIPVIAMAMQLGSAAAGFVAATAPTDVSALETPVQTRARPEPGRSVAEPRVPPRPDPAHEQPESGPIATPRSHPIGDRSLADPLLGYGI